MQPELLPDFGGWCALGQGERPNQLVGLREPHRELHAGRRYGSRIRGGMRVRWIALANRTAALTNEEAGYGELSLTVRDEWARDIPVRAVKFEMAATPISDREADVIATPDACEHHPRRTRARARAARQRHQSERPGRLLPHRLDSMPAKSATTDSNPFTTRAKRS